MKKSPGFVRDIWVKIQLKTPSFVRRAIIPRLHEAKEFIRLLTKPNLPVYQLQGQRGDSSLTVTYVGFTFAKPFLKKILFTEEPQEREIKRIPFWQLNQLTTLASSDLTIIEATKGLIIKFSNPNDIVLPEFVRHILDVRGDWTDVQSRFRKTVRKNELRLIRRYGYEYDVSHEIQDFEEFYYQMYLPTMNDRHEDLSMPVPFWEAYQLFRHGCLFRIKRDGIWVSGGVCHPEQNVLMFDIMGMRNADAQLIRDGAMTACYYATIHWANQNGYEALNFRGSNPYMNIGLFQYKRKWGASVRIPPHLHRWIWLRVNQNTPAVSQFLKENPLIIVDREENLHGLIAVDDVNNVTPEDLVEWKKLYATPGLTSLIIRPVSHFIQKPTTAAHSDLIIPISSEISEDSE